MFAALLLYCLRMQKLHRHLVDAEDELLRGLAAHRGVDVGKALLGVQCQEVRLVSWPGLQTLTTRTKPGEDLSKDAALQSYNTPAAAPVCGVRLPLPAASGGGASTAIGFRVGVQKSCASPRASCRTCRPLAGS